MRVVFMGTPDIAATCLKHILENGHNVVAVYTQPDRPKNRGMKLAFSPVKEVALAHDLPVYQPENFRDEQTVEQLRRLQPDVVAVVAYGRILPQSVLDIQILDGEDGLQYAFDYAASRYKKETMSEFQNLFKRVIATIVNANTDGYTFAQLKKDVCGKTGLLQRIKAVFVKEK